MDANDILRARGPEALRAAIDAAVSANGRADGHAAHEPPEPPPLTFDDYEWAGGFEGIGLSGDQTVGRGARAAAAGVCQTAGLPLKFWGDLGEITPPDRLVRKLLGTTSLVAVYGPPGCGKTFLATSLGAHIALGRAWFGRKVTAGAVIYCAGEGVAGIGNRLAGFKQRHDLEDDVPFAVIPVAVDLGPGGTDADKVIEAAAAVEERTGQTVQLIVVDTLARSTGRGDENSTQDMGAFIAACDRIRQETGATVLIVHHTGKSAAAGARGSSALLAAVDTAIEVEARKKGCVAKVVKQKDGAAGAEIGFDLEVVEIGRDDDGEPITTCVVYPTGQVAKALPKLTSTEKRAMDVLHNVLVHFGETLGNSVTFPSVTLVKIERFRQALKSSGVTDRDKPENERSQWRRITTSLANKGVFAMRDEYCWAVTDRDKA